MKKTLFLVSLVAAFAAGCTQDDGAQAPSATPDVAAATPAAEAPAKPDNGLAEPLPEGVRLMFANRVRSDRIVDRGEGRYRRRIGLNYLEGTQEATYKAISDELVAAGFAERERDDKSNGNIRSKFDKAKFGTVIVTITPVGDEKTSENDGKGRVLLDWPARAPRQ